MHAWSWTQNNGNHPIRTAKRKTKNDNSLRDLWDNIKSINICIIGVSDVEDREKRVENVFDEVMAENFPNLKKVTYPGTGNTQGPKQDEPKQTHTKTYHNENGKS